MSIPQTASFFYSIFQYLMPERSRQLSPSRTQIANIQSLHQLRKPNKKSRQNLEILCEFGSCSFPCITFSFDLISPDLISRLFFQKKNEKTRQEAKVLQES